MAKKDEELSEQAASGKGQLNSDLWGHRFSQNANKKITKISTLEVYLRVLTQEVYLRVAQKSW